MESAIYYGMESDQRSEWNHGNAVYGIKPQVDARWRVMICKDGEPPLMICTALRAAMICQACGLDKKILVPKNEDFL